MDPLKRDEITTQALHIVLAKFAERARESLLAFTLFTKNDYEINWHHAKLCEKLDDFARGKIPRLIVSMPPRHGKSELVSRRLPAFILGRLPNSQIIAASYGADLAARMNRDVQRIMESAHYAELFPKSTLNESNVRSAAQGTALRNSDIFEIVNHAGVYRSAGVGGAITGMGANFAIIDDPIKNQEEADSITYRDKVWDWYTSTLYTRLEKEGSVLLTMCMTGDTRVLMADSSHKNLRDIKIGDSIATYDNGKVSTSTIRNWKSCGHDLVFKIRMSSGITVKANERHPFLVLKNGATEWVRLKDLRVGDNLMRVGERCEENCAQYESAESPQSVRACACPTTIRRNGHLDTDHHQSIPSHAGIQNYDTDMGSHQKLIPQCSPSRKASVPCVEIPLSEESICPSIGMKFSALTTTTQQEKFAPCSVTSAISSLSTVTPKRSYLEPLSIYEPTLDTIVEISSAGTDEVFDIQVDRTENFIANGLVSHNTRWHEDDLAGRLINLAKADPESDQWEVFEFPAIKDSEDNPDDPRELDEALWPGKYDKPRLAKIKSTAGSRVWNALYQQRPSALEGGIIKRSWIKFYRELPGRLNEQIQSWDATFKDTKKADFVCGTVWARWQADKYLITEIRGRMDIVATIQAILTTSARYPKAYTKLIEDKANGPAIISLMKGKVSGLIPIEPEGSKEARLSAVAPDFEAGNVWFPHPDIAPWIHDFIEELVNFPNAKNDDRVDSLTQGLLRLQNAYKNEFSKEMIPDKIKSIASSLGRAEW